MSESAAALVGILGSAHAWVGSTGAVHPCSASWELDWAIGADDRWHLPAREPAVRQSLLGAAPIVQTAMRVPGGDAIERVYGVGGALGLVVVEIENASAAPFVATLVLRPVPGGKLRSVSLGDSRVYANGRPALLAPRPPRRWATGAGPSAAVDRVIAGEAAEGGLPPVANRRGRLEVALLFPVAHRTTLRLALVLASGRGAPLDAVDLSLLPPPADVARGWVAQLERGMRVVLPDPQLQTAVDASRAALLLSASMPKPASRVDRMRALEDWGFDDEAEEAWGRLRFRERHRVARRAPATDPWTEVRRRLETASSTWAWPDGPAPFLGTVRDLLVAERHDGAVALLTELPPDWCRRDLEVHDAPTRAGRVSYAVRWHGTRPALLWQCERPGVSLRAPGLDPAWATTDPRGEALLASPTGNNLA